MTGKEDKGPLHMQKPQPHESTYNQMEKPHVAQPLNNNFVGGNQVYDPSDPQAVIRSAKAPPVMKSQEIIDESEEKRGKIAD